MRNVLWVGWVLVLVGGVCAGGLKEERREFQGEELITARPNGFIFNPGQAPRVVWRDVDGVRKLGSDGVLRVRWFDAKLNEVAEPKESGRWGAVVEGVAPNGTVVRRGLTFYCRPKMFLTYFPPDSQPKWVYQPGPISAEVWGEHEGEFPRVSVEMMLRTFADSEAGSILLAGLSEARALGRTAGFSESAAVANAEYHLALKLKLAGMAGKVRPLQMPRKRSVAAEVLREGTAAEAGMAEDAKARIDGVCRAWAEDTGEPMVTLVARHGVIVTHEAFGKDKAGQAVRRDYRCEVASITKTVTAILFSQFVDQGLIDLEKPVSSVFWDYRKDDAHVPTFRQCFMHTSGLSGHGDFGGMRNAYLENVILNGLDVNEPGKRYEYSGNGFELAAKAMEIVAGKSAVRLYHENLFGPLKLGDVPVGGASFGAQLTARELGVLAQWVANRGSYGEMEFISHKTFEAMMPVAVNVADRNYGEEEGIGMHWLRHVKAGAKKNSKRGEDLLFSARTVGHGSLTGCVFLIDLDRDLIVVQARRQGGARSGEWSGKFYQAVSEAMKEENRK